MDHNSRKAMEHRKAQLEGELDEWEQFAARATSPAVRSIAESRIAPCREAIEEIDRQLAAAEAAKG